MSDDLIIIPKIDRRFKRFTPSACWIPTVSFKTKEQLKPLIRCKCGTLCGIKTHSISSDGTINPSFYHDKENMNGCGWHVLLKLDKYNLGSFD